MEEQAPLFMGLNGARSDSGTWKLKGFLTCIMGAVSEKSNDLKAGSASWKSNDINRMRFIRSSLVNVESGQTLMNL